MAESAHDCGEQLKKFLCGKKWKIPDGIESSAGRGHGMCATNAREVVGQPAEQRVVDRVPYLHIKTASDLCSEMRGKLCSQT